MPTRPDGPLWQESAAFAARAHRGQVRIDGVTPYVSHVFRVAMTVRDVFGCDDEVTLAAALLHDTIEDTRTDYDELYESFGKLVADVVAALTKNKGLPEAEREREYDARLAGADWRARLVKLADTYDNLCDSLHGPRSVEKSLEKCRRALELTRSDEAQNAVVARAAGAVRTLLAACERGRPAP